jgi:hypothetical protein
VLNLKAGKMIGDVSSMLVLRAGLDPVYSAWLFQTNSCGIFFFCHSAVTTSVTASLKYFKAHCLLLFLNVFFLNLPQWAIRLDETPVRKHNDPAIDYHVSLYEYVVIGYELIAARDVVRINMSSVWMLANTLHAIIAGWNF